MTTTKSKVSIIVPSRNERFLQPTIDSLLRHARGDVEIVVVLDGYWPTPALTSDERLIVLHRGTAQGMRPAINSAVECTAGEWLMKIDAHCDVSPGYDEILKAECDRDWIVVPRRMSLDPFTWQREENGKSPVDAHYLSYPFERPDDPTCGLHGTVWNQRARQRRDVLLDEEMSSQGSCWFMSRAHWDRCIGAMDIAKYGNFIQEFQELGLKTWLSGGKCMVQKKCHYLHWHKGKHGRGYVVSGAEHRRGADFAVRYWMLDQWQERKRDLRWLIERFAPVPSWPTDLDEAFAIARRELT